MHIRFGFEITIDCPSNVPVILALSMHPDAAGHVIGENRIHADPLVDMQNYSDRFGNHLTRLIAPTGRLNLWTDCAVEIDPAPDTWAPDAIQHKVEDLTPELLEFLLPSRYCDSDRLVNFAWEKFGDAPEGWQRVQAICDYVNREISFGYKFGRPTKTASEVHLEKSGVCRDFAHLAISLCRAMNIPARYASGYLGDIGAPYSGPGDFSAWFEVFLGGRWYTLDARFNTPRIGRILMVRGIDAADVAMIMSFGACKLEYFRVWTDEMPTGLSDADILTQLQTRPSGEALVYPSSGRAI